MLKDGPDMVPVDKDLLHSSPLTVKQREHYVVFSLFFLFIHKNNMLVKLQVSYCYNTAFFIIFILMRLSICYIPSIYIIKTSCRNRSSSYCINASVSSSDWIKPAYCVSAVYSNYPSFSISIR